jgi:hypothetical protein
MNELQDIPSAKKFLQHIEKHRITQLSIVKGLPVSNCHLSLVLRQKRELSESLRAKLNAFLNTDF